MIYFILFICYSSTFSSTDAPRESCPHNHRRNSAPIPLMKDLHLSCVICSQISDKTTSLRILAGALQQLMYNTYKHTIVQLTM